MTASRARVPGQDYNGIQEAFDRHIKADLHAETL